MRWRILAVLLLSALGLRASGQGTDETEALLAQAQKLLAQKTPDSLRKSIEDYEQALSLASKAGDTAKQFQALLGLAWAHFLLHETNASLNALDQARDLAKNDRASQALVLGMLGLVTDAAGDEDKALGYLTQSRDIWQSLGEKNNEAQVLQTEGTVYQKKGNLPRAIESFEQALALFRDGHNQAGEIISLVRLGGLNKLLGRPDTYEKAISAYQQALPLAQALGDRFNEAYAWRGLGDSYFMLHRKREAAESYRKALPLFASLKGAADVPKVLAELCASEDRPEDSAQAVEDCARALPGLKTGSSALAVLLAEMHLGQAYENLGKMPEALQAYQDAIEASRAAGDQASEAAGYLRAGGVHFSRADWPKAIEADNQALKIFRATNNVSGQVSALLALSSAYQSTGDYQKDNDCSLEALRLAQSDPSELQMETVLMSVADSYSWLGETDKALNYFNRALALADKYPAQKALLLTQIGEVYSTKGDQQSALTEEQQSLEIYRSLANPAGQAKALDDIGLAYAALGNEPAARDSYNKALALEREQKNLHGQCGVLANLGELDQYFGDNKEAETLYNESLALSRRLGDQWQEANTLAKLGMVLHALGEESQALDALNQSLAIYLRLGNRHGEATALGNLAVFYTDTGDPQQALESLARALDLHRDLDDALNEATALDNIATAYRSLGDYDHAQQYFGEALEIRQKLRDEPGEAVVFNNLAVVAQLTKDSVAAHRYYNEALKLAQKTGNKLGQARVLASEAVLYSEEGDTQRALDYLTRSLELSRQTRDLDSEALALHNLGSVREKLGNPRQAIEEDRQALPLWRKIHSVEGEAQTLYTMAKDERVLGDLETALGHVEQAIALGESARSRIASKTLRSSYLATVSAYYELQIALLMQLDGLHPGKNYPAQALEASERGRARSLLDLLNQSHADNIRVGVDPQLLATERGIENSIHAKTAERLKLLASSSRSAPAQAQHLELEIENLTAEYEKSEQRIKTQNPAYAALTNPEPLTSQQIQQLLDPDTLLLEYSLGKDRSFVWAVTPTSILSFELPGRAQIDENANQYRDILSNKRQNAAALQEAASYLSTKLLGPVAAQLGNKRLVFVADGALQEIPFAALPSPSHSAGPLIAEHEIVSEPSASALAVLRRDIARRPLPPNLVAVIADPVFQRPDKRLLRASAESAPEESDTHALLTVAARETGFNPSGGIPSLPYTRNEATEILKLSPADRSLALLGFKATKSAAQNPELAQYRIIHFATHGLLNPVHPEFSGLLFSLFDEQGQPQDGFLKLDDIFNLRLPVQLVVLSACQSGEGKLINGEGLVGLTRAFMYAGASTLAVTLWSVQDAATAELMARFYEGLFGSEHLTPAAALRRAQLSLLEYPEWKHPYFWAPFIVQGDWR